MNPTKLPLAGALMTSSLKATACLHESTALTKPPMTT
jgi:hypothetical protein